MEACQVRLLTMRDGSHPYKLGEQKQRSREVPNYCENHTSIMGPVDELRACALAMVGDDSESRLANLVPMPENTEDWYSWCLDNWGTKWGDRDHWSEDAFDVHEYGDGDGYLNVSYLTAWGPFSLAFWVEVSRRFPNLTFDTTYEEGANCFAGAIVAAKGVGAEAYTEELPEFDEPQDYCDAMCDLRDALLTKATLDLMAVTA